MNKKTRKQNTKLIHKYSKPCRYYLRSKVLPLFINKCLYKLRSRDVVLRIHRQESNDTRTIKEKPPDETHKLDKQTVECLLVDDMSEVNKKNDLDIFKQYDDITEKYNTIVLDDSSTSCKSIVSNCDESTNNDLSTIDCMNVNETQLDNNDMLPHEVLLSVEGSNKVFQCMIV